MKRRVADPIVQATTIVVVLKLIKVRAYTCVRLGKNEKVRSHWRRLRGACTETCVAVSKQRQSAILPRFFISYYRVFNSITMTGTGAPNVNNISEVLV